MRLHPDNTQTQWKEIPEEPFRPDEEIPDPFPFRENVGLKHRMRDDATVLDYLQLYLADHICDHIVTETNRFAEHFFRDNADSENQYVGLWEPLTRNELKQFIGLSLLMGIVYKPIVSLYWSTDKLFSKPIFSCSFSIDIKILTF